MSIYNCNVLNCGNGKCIHQLLDEKCPHCGKPLVRVTTTGYKFCSAGTSIYDCDYGIDDPTYKNQSQKW